VNRTVGLTLRRTAGGSLIFAIGFGALTSAPPEIAAGSAGTISARASSIPATEAVAYRLPRSQFSSVTTQAALPITSVPLARSATGAATARASRPVTTPATVTRSKVPRPASPPKAAPVVTRAVGPVAGGANAFAYGYCTWWVAHKRNIPWRGNAAQWWWNARAFGAPEGATPKPGAIMVMGISASSPQGHVAYVEAINPNGSFLISEMNWWGVPGGGWGRVDYRTVTSMRGILGFIY
jgi:surface antigen